MIYSRRNITSPPMIRAAFVSGGRRGAAVMSGFGMDDRKTGDGAAAVRRSAGVPTEIGEEAHA